MSPLRLSLDVLLEILRYVDRPHLAALCRVNQVLHDVASDMLYRKIEGPSDFVPLCVNLWAYPHLASRVRHFEINIDQRSRRLPQTYALFANTLQRLPNLRSLVLRETGSLSWMLKECSFMLQSFYCAFECDLNLVHFLESQTELQEVTLCLPLNTEFCIPSTALPKLVKASAPSSWLNKIVPGRPIRTVIFRDRESAMVDLTFLSFSTVGIQKLVASASSFRDIPHTQIRHYFPALLDLTIVDIKIQVLIFTRGMIYARFIVLIEFRMQEHSQIGSQSSPLRSLAFVASTLSPAGWIFLLRMNPAYHSLQGQHSERRKLNALLLIALSILPSL